MKVECISYSSCCCDEVLQQSKLRNKGLTSAHGLSLQSVVEGASLWQELEVIQHTGPAVRKQSTLDTYVQLAFLVSIAFRGLSQRMVPHTVMIHNQCNQDNPPT